MVIFFPVLFKKERGVFYLSKINRFIWPLWRVDFYNAETYNIHVYVKL